MPPTDASAKVYQELADWYEQQRDGPMRDRFLLLAAASLLASGHKDEVEKIRLRLLKLNPNHLVKPFPSMAEAVKSRDVREYIEGLRRNYSPPAASQLLESLRGTSGGTPRQTPAPTATGPAEDLPVLEPIVARRPSAGKRDPAAKNERPPSKEPAPVQHQTEGEAKSRFSRPPRLWAEGPPTSWRDGLLEADRPDPPAGAWLSTVLFCATLIGGIALAGYLFGRVFTQP
jgi:hypothetical protein